MLIGDKKIDMDQALRAPSRSVHPVPCAHEKFTALILQNPSRIEGAPRGIDGCQLFPPGRAIVGHYLIDTMLYSQRTGRRNYLR